MAVTGGRPEKHQPGVFGCWSAFPLTGQGETFRTPDEWLPSIDSNPIHSLQSFAAYAISPVVLLLSCVASHQSFAGCTSTPPAGVPECARPVGWPHAQGSHAQHGHPVSRTGRNRNLSLKGTNEAVERFYKMADERKVTLGGLLERAVDALEKSATPAR